jgi:hypothetical protein
MQIDDASGSLAKDQLARITSEKPGETGRSAVGAKASESSAYSSTPPRLPTNQFAGDLGRLAILREIAKIVDPIHSGFQI